MLIYILLVAEIIILNALRVSDKVSKRQLCWIIGVSMILITGLRSVNVGSDTTVYYYNFLYLQDMTLPEIMALEKRDFGFYILSWLVNSITGSFTVLTLIAAVSFYVPVTMLIEKYSDDPGLSFLTLMAFNFFQFSMTGIRQTIAIGMSILLVMELLKQKPRYFWCFVWIFLGFSMHRSAILVLIFFVLRLIWNKKGSIYFTLFLIPIMILFRDSIIAYLEEPLGEWGFEIGDNTVVSGGFTTFFVFLILLIWGVFLTKKGYDTMSKTMPYNLLLLFELAVVLQPLVFSNSVLFRIVWYFSIYLIIYIPRLISASTVTNASKPIVNTVMYAGILYMYLFMTIGSANVAPYQFFFQG